jgi:hypothetical protein
MTGERCCMCGLDVAAWRVVRDGKVFCCAWCRDHAPPVDARRVDVQTARMQTTTPALVVRA